MSNITFIQDDDLANFDAETGGKTQMLVFSAAWCAPCKAMAPSVEDLADAHAGTIAVAKVDIEQSPGIAAAFGVRGVPMIVVRRDQTELARHVGGLSRTRLEMMIEDNAAEVRS